MLSGPQRKFCEEVVRGLNGTDAYALAYPKAKRAAARAQAARLLAKPSIQAEITVLRADAQKVAGSAVMDCAEKRIFCARVVRARIADLPSNSDLFSSITHGKHGAKYELPDKLAAIRLDNDLAGEGSEAAGNDALGALLERIRK